MLSEVAPPPSQENWCHKINEGRRRRFKICAPLDVMLNQFPFVPMHQPCSGYVNTGTVHKLHASCILVLFRVLKFQIKLEEVMFM